jgi:hypothetical protein
MCGQRRSHALRFAQEGAAIIAVDICQPFANSPAPAATSEDLLETADAVKGLFRPDLENPGPDDMAPV